MNVDTGRVRAESFEAALRNLRDVDHVRVVLDPQDDVREVHVTTCSERPARQLVRDVQSVLLARFGKSVDRRFVSVAYEEGRNGHAAPARAASPLPAPPASGPPRHKAAERIRFGSVNLFVSGPRAQAQVELRWKGITRMGSAAGTATRDGAHLLVAAATVAALEQFLEEGWSLGVEGVQFARFGQDEVAVVALTLLAHRREKTLAGCCAVEQDVPQAVALATLAALNRVVGGLETREPIEYVLRPSSVQEASGA